MTLDARRTRKGIAFGVALAVVSSLGSAVGYWSHTVGDESHPHHTPRNKSCVGDPPRQAEDPLSPPCVPFFDGDNGDATARGVTAEEVLIALYNDFGLEGDVETLPKPEGPAFREHRSLVRTVRTQATYFRNRFQTYNRFVRVVAVAATGVGATCDEQVTDARRAHDLEVFAAIVAADSSRCFQAELASLGIPSIGMGRDLDRVALNDADGLAATFYPDAEEDALVTAAFICDQLLGRQARFSTDPLLAGSDRRIEILAPAAPEAERFRSSASMLRSEVDARCETSSAIRLYVEAGPLGRIELPPVDPSTLPIVGDDDEDEEEGPVTSYVCVCDVANGDLAELQRAHAAEGPEWILPMIARGDDARTLGLGSEPDAPVFGVTSRWVLPEPGEQFATRAYHSVHPRSEPNLAHNHDVYHALMLGFSALQGAGPHLTVANWKRGVQTFQLSDGTGDKPDGRFRDDDQVNTFRETALSWWWNPSGEGSTGVQGCIASAANAGSSRAVGSETGWSSGDGDLYVGTCLQPERVEPA